MEIIDEDDEHEEEGKNERQNESENRVILGTIKRKQNERPKLENENWSWKIIFPTFSRENNFLQMG